MESTRWVVPTSAFRSLISDLCLRMHRIKHRERHRAEQEDGQPGGEGRGEVLIVAQAFAGETGREEDATQAKAEGSADKDVAVLVAENDRQSEEDEDQTQD